MTYLQRLVASRNAYKNFEYDVKNGLGHAYMLICDDPYAREEFLKIAAKRVFCDDVFADTASNIAIEGNNHLDVRFFDGDKMNVKSVTELTENAAIRPVVSDRKLYLIDNADKLSPQAQNKLLKTYEEPPEFLTIILACSDENGILPTIRSRAKKLNFESFTSSEIAAYLQNEGYEADKIEVAAALGGGSIARSENYLSDEKSGDLYLKCFDLLLNLNSSGNIVDYLYGESFTKENVLLTLDFLEIIICDAMKLNSKSGAPLQNVGREFDLRKISEKFTPQSAAMALYAISAGRKKLNFYINSVTSAEKILFDILEARYKWQ